MRVAQHQINPHAREEIPSTHKYNSSKTRKRAFNSNHGRQPLIRFGALPCFQAKKLEYCIGPKGVVEIGSEAPLMPNPFRRAVHARKRLHVQRHDRFAHVNFIGVKCCATYLRGNGLNCLFRLERRVNGKQT